MSAQAAAVISRVVSQQQLIHWCIVSTWTIVFKYFLDLSTPDLSWLYKLCAIISDNRNKTCNRQAANNPWLMTLNPFQYFSMNHASHFNNLRFHFIVKGMYTFCNHWQIVNYRLSLIVSRINCIDTIFNPFKQAIIGNCSWSI